MAKGLFYWCVFLWAVEFFLMGWDKRQARREGRRVPEKRFFLLALLGGALGAICGMYGFRHKTKHWYFQVGMPAIFLLHLALIWLWLNYGIHFLPL